jgi:MoaA/NifB/PqqE/SkfB family radical SAM enzyme
MSDVRTTPLTRGEDRPVNRRTRTFRPNYLSFAGTYQCNLACPHCCVPIEWPDRLDSDEFSYDLALGAVGFPHYREPPHC